MKHGMIALALIIFSTQHTLFSMDLPPVYTKVSQTINTGLSENQIVAKIDEAINEKYSYNFFVDSFVTLSSEKMLDIIQITQAHYPHITESTIKKLEDNNTLFRQSIDYFIKKASENLEKITANNIKTIENPKNHQPVDELNKLPQIFKTYVMDQVFKMVQYVGNHNYDIVLKGEHINPITAFDICEVTDQAITSSIAESNYSFKGSLNLSSKYYSGKLVLWNLKTGKPIYTHSETDPIYIVTFSPNGSQIAGAMYTENAIKVWCTKTKQLLHKLSSDHGIDSISFSSTGSALTSLYTGPYADDMHINQWLLTPDNKPGELINSSKVYGARTQNSGFGREQYYALHPVTYLTTPKTELHITKKTCPPLYLCMQAIQKSKDRSHIAQLIESSASFHSLTDIEIQKVHFEMNRK